MSDIRSPKGPDFERLSDSELEVFERRTQIELEVLKRERQAREESRQAEAREAVRTEAARRLAPLLKDSELWQRILGVGCSGFEVSKIEQDGETVTTLRLLERPEGNAGLGRSRSAYTRLAAGLRLPQEKYEEPILRAIQTVRGEASHKQFLPLVFQRLEDQMDELDLAPLATGGPRWEKAARWAVGSLNQKGEIERTRRGHYRITDRGQRRLRRAGA